MENTAGTIMLILLAALMSFVLGVFYKTFRLNKDFKETLKDILTNSPKSTDDIQESCINDILLNFINNRELSANDYITLVQLNKGNETNLKELTELINLKNIQNKQEAYDNNPKNKQCK